MRICHLIKDFSGLKIVATPDKIWATPDNSVDMPDMCSPIVTLASYFFANLIENFPMKITIIAILLDYF